MNIKIVEIKNTEDILNLYPKADKAKLEKMRKEIKLDLQDAQDGNRVIFGAQFDNKIIGAGQVIFKTKDNMADGETTVHLHHGRVHKDFRNMGVGTKFVEVREKEAKRRGFKFMTISVEATNRGALRLDRRLGYQEFKRYKGKAGEDLIGLKKEL